MVFQSFEQLLPWKTVIKNVMYPLERSMYGDKLFRWVKAKEYLKLVGLEKFSDYYPHQLSSGMKQRVAIARALATQAKIILMDEPFGSLDDETRKMIQKELLEIWKKLKITIVFITHNLSEAIYLANRIIVLSHSPAQIKYDITNPVEGNRYPNSKGHGDFWTFLSECI
jgi:NitT/TauT family transport system ATP-binding protein